MSKSTRTETLDIDAVASRTMLVLLNTGAWRATRLHKTETREENLRHKTDVAKVMVKLTNSESLTDLNKLHAAAFAAHRRLTMPTVQDGMRMVPATRQFEHSGIMSDFQRQHEKLADTFAFKEYKQEKASAPRRLNGLYDPTMWPSEDAMREKFKFAFRYLHTPTEGAWGDWLKESARAAQAELHDRLEGALERLRDRCNGGGKLYATVFTELQDLLQLCPDFNFTDDSAVAKAVKAAAPLAVLEPVDVKSNPVVRANAAKRAGDILSILGGIK